MDIELIVGLCILVLILVSIVFGKTKSKWINRDDFEAWKGKISNRCDEETLRQFIEFLKKYGGGYVKRHKGQIIRQEYLNKEKGDLKGIFYHVIVPNKNISVDLKEEYRKYIINLGVQGVSKKPIYELRDGKLKNNSKNEEEKRIKQVGNHGEQIVRSYLKKLDEKDFLILSGVEVKSGERIREFDHLVLGNDVIFLLETKAFGMNQDMNIEKDKANLYIDQGDNWKIFKWGKMHDIKSPTEQIKAEKDFLDEIIHDSFIKVIPVVLLANDLLKVKQNIPLDYDVVLLKDLCEYIKSKNPDTPLSDRRDILKKIDEKRIN